MWMTSSSRAERVGRATTAFVLTAIAALMGCRGAGPDAPRPAPIAGQAPQPPFEDSSAYAGTIELAAVRVGKLDPVMQRMAGPDFLKAATEPLAIEVQTQRPLPKTPRTTSPVIFLNGERLDNTWVIQPNRLVAFLPDRRKIKDINAVTAAWIGAESSSLTQKPLTFRAQEVRQ